MELVLIWLICGVISAVIGSRKGEGCAAFLIGVMLGPFGIVFALVSKGDRKPCEFCKEMVHKDALKCKHCGASLRSIVKNKDNKNLQNGAVIVAIAMLLFALFVGYKIIG